MHTRSVGHNSHGRHDGVPQPSSSTQEAVGDQHKPKTSNSGLLRKMGGCPNHGPFLGSQYSTALVFRGPKKGTIILITIHVPAVTCGF